MQYTPVKGNNKTSLPLVSETQVLPSGLVRLERVWSEGVGAGHHVRLPQHPPFPHYL